MYKGKKILLVIPARGGSKRIPNKNIRMLLGKPMIFYTIKAALGSRYVDRVIVSTDSEKIARVARKNGAEVPFIRPAELATDTAKTVDVLRHAINFLSSSFFNPDLVVLVNPTNPLVLPEDIDGSIRKISVTKADSCLAVSEISQRPEWMYRLNKNKKATLFAKSNKGLSTRSQDLEKLYILNGSVYVLKKDLIVHHGDIHGNNPSIYVMPKERCVDIDELIDLKVAEVFLRELRKDFDIKGS